VLLQHREAFTWWLRWHLNQFLPILLVVRILLDEWIFLQCCQWELCKACMYCYLLAVLELFNNQTEHIIDVFSSQLYSIQFMNIKCEVKTHCRHFNKRTVVFARQIFALFAGDVSLHVHCAHSVFTCERSMNYTACPRAPWVSCPSS
jgi:hypothetical protein